MSDQCAICAGTVSKDAVFVFGSNLAGRHGQGAARHAALVHGARYGLGLGYFGRSFAIPTKDEHIKTLPLDRIATYVQYFIAQAESYADTTFYVTRVGCGLAGYTDAQIAPLFATAPLNCILPEAWIPWTRPNRPS